MDADGETNYLTLGDKDGELAIKDSKDSLASVLLEISIGGCQEQKDSQQDFSCASEVEAEEYFK